MKQTLFIVSSKNDLSMSRYLPNIVYEEPPIYSNSSLAYWSHILASLSQMQLKLITWPLTSSLTSSPADLLSFTSPDFPILAGKCGRQSQPQVDFLLLECEKREAYNFVQWLNREVSKSEVGEGSVRKSEVEEDSVRRILRILMDGRMTNYPVRWMWSKQNFCESLKTL